MARALYIHWPFCAKKCPYCDFNSHVRDSVDVAAWQSALLADMRAEAELAGAEPLTSIFFGGGTPSLMEAETAEAVIRAATDAWTPAEDLEITLEANPDSMKLFGAFGDACRASGPESRLALFSGWQAGSADTVADDQFAPHVAESFGSAISAVCERKLGVFRQVGVWRHDKFAKEIQCAARACEGCIGDLALAEGDALKERPVIAQRL